MPPTRNVAAQECRRPGMSPPRNVAAQECRRPGMSPTRNVAAQECRRPGMSPPRNVAAQECRRPGMSPPRNVAAQECRQCGDIESDVAGRQARRRWVLPVRALELAQRPMNLLKELGQAVGIERVVGRVGHDDFCGPLEKASLVVAHDAVPRRATSLIGRHGRRRADFRTIGGWGPRVGGAVASVTSEMTRRADTGVTSCGLGAALRAPARSGRRRDVGKLANGGHQMELLRLAADRRDFALREAPRENVEEVLRIRRVL